MQGRRQKNLVLILAREFASKLATPMFVADADGNLVFYNEPAEDVLGKSYAEIGEISAEEWTKLFKPEDLSGQPLGFAERPTGCGPPRRPGRARRAIPAARWDRWRQCGPRSGRRQVCADPARNIAVVDRILT